MRPWGSPSQTTNFPNSVYKKIYTITEQKKKEVALIITEQIICLFVNNARLSQKLGVFVKAVVSHQWCCCVTYFL